MTMNKLRSALPDLIGRTIEHLVVNDHGAGDRQIFLFFTDGTYYEFYGTHLSGIRHLDKGGLEIPRQNGRIPVNGRLEIIDAEISELFERPPVPTSPETLAQKLGRSVA